MLKIFHASPDYNYSNWINSTATASLESADLVMFLGGTDINPNLYNKKMGSYTEISDFKRDAYEKVLFERCLELNKPMLGICRGSQLLCGLNGGELIQHQGQKTKNGMHNVLTNTGEEILITSSHHQAAFPYNMGKDSYEVLGWTPYRNQSDFHLNGDDKEISKEPFNECEIVFYPKTKSLGIQGHPEWMDNVKHSNTFSFLQKLLERLLS